MDEGWDVFVRNDGHINASTFGAIAQKLFARLTTTVVDDIFSSPPSAHGHPVLSSQR